MNASVGTKEEEVIPNGELLDPCFCGVIPTVISSRVIMECVIRE
jgi:hypothetical protein